MDRREKRHFFQGLQFIEDPREIDIQKKACRVIDQILVLFRLHVLAFDKLVFLIIPQPAPGPSVQIEAQNIEDLAGYDTSRAAKDIRGKVLMIFFPSPGQFFIVIHRFVPGDARVFDGKVARRGAYGNAHWHLHLSGVLDKRRPFPVGRLGLRVFKGDIFS